MKKCNKCSAEKPLSEFNICSKMPDGRNGSCRSCYGMYFRQYRENNRSKVLESKKASYQRNKKTWDTYRSNNSEKIAETKRQWYAKKVKEDKSFSLYERLRKMVYRTLVYTGEKKQRGSKEVLGYDHTQLKERISQQFKRGMSWDNYGQWHIDHIKPIKAFIDEGITDPAKINALDNLQPLWASENISKGASYAN